LDGNSRPCLMCEVWSAVTSGSLKGFLGGEDGAVSADI
jgi:hypothetical protein